MARLVTFFFALVFFTQCKQPQEELKFFYEGDTFSFQLESQEDRGLFQGSGQSSGAGFYRATGDLEYIFSNIWKGYQYRVDPKWKGKKFDFTLRFSDGEDVEGLFQQVAEEVDRQSGMSIALAQKTVPAHCLKVGSPTALASHQYQMEGGVEERIDQTNYRLVAEGMSLHQITAALNNGRPKGLYVYEGKDESKYSFNLDISNSLELEKSLAPYGLSLENCQVAVKTVEIK